MSSAKKADKTAKGGGAKKVPPPFLGAEHGIEVLQTEEGFEVKIPYDRQLQAMMERVPGANFSKESKAYNVPAASQEPLGTAIAGLRKMAKSIEDDLANIKELAAGSARRAQDSHGHGHATPQISDFHESGRSYSGEIVNANGSYVAQLTGFGKQDGAAFVSIHRVADLSQRNIMKGDQVRIEYDQRFVGQVSPFEPRKSVAEMTAAFNQQLGKEIDGVTLTDRGDNIGIAFAMNLSLTDRIRRVDGAVFNKDDKVWEVPKRNQEYALRAANDMRKDYVLDQNEVELMSAIAESKIDGAKVRQAFAKDGQRHIGQIIAVGDRFALQKTSRSDFALHHLAALSEPPAKDHNLQIEYQKGKGQVVDLDLKRAQDKALGACR